MTDVGLNIGDWLPSRAQPTTALQALMEARPHEDPQVSIAERLNARETIAQAVETLTPEELWIFNALVIEGLSLRAVARQLGMGKTTVAIRRDQALAKLRALLEDDPDIQTLLGEA